MAEKRVLVIDDEYDFMEGDLKRGLGGHGFQAEGTIDPSKALDFIESYKPDIILLDIFFPGGEMGKTTLETIKKKYPSYPPVIMISDTMLKSKYNAEDYQSADARYPKELMASKEDIADFAKQMNNIIDNATGKTGLGFLVGNTRYMKEMEKNIRLVADTDATVSITGEPGTGKELVACAIDRLSKRTPFITVNCGALSENLLESEIFGHEKGVFTGAIYKKLGRVALAEGGILFLDEIGDATPALQVKLLRVLREKKYETVGGTETLKADVRIIAATNKNLKDLVSKGKYREDLYYRLNVFPIHLPPLRERKEDIPLLAEHFIRKVGSSVKPILRDDVKALLLAYHWPGNIAELENVITSAVILAKNDKILQPIHFPDLTEKGKSSRTGKISRQNMQPKGIHAGRFFCRPFIVGKKSMVIVLKARIWQTCYLSSIATSGVFYQSMGSN
jgi:DNA-binding NtrC family response regulator